MQDGNSRNFSFPAQLGILVGLTGVGMILASFVSAFIWTTATHQPLLSMQSEMGNRKYYFVIMAIQGISTIFMMFLPVIFFSMICYKKVWLFTGAATSASLKQFLLVTGILVLVFPLGGALAELNKAIPIPQKWAVKFKEMEDNRKAMEEALISIDTFSKYLISLLVIAILPAIIEEFYFRAGLQNIFTRWFSRPLAAIILTSVIFSIIHISYYGFLVRFALGIVLGYVFYYSGNIWPSVFLHFLFNGLQVTAMYVLKASDKINARDVEENFPLWAGIPALLLLIILFRMFRKESINVNEKFIYNKPDPDDIHDWIANR